MHVTCIWFHVHCPLAATICMLELNVMIVFFVLSILGGTGTYSVPLRALTPSRVWGFQAPQIVGGQGRRGPHV